MAEANGWALGALLVSALALLAACAAILLLRHRLWHMRAAIDRLQGSHTSILRAERINAAADERARLLADLHDDIGAKLLTLVHTLENPEHADLARAIVQDFRDVVSRSNQDACTLLQALGQIREETEQRLEAVGSSLEWLQLPALPDPALDEAQTLHLFRITREALTNSLRHGHATHIRVRIIRVEQQLILDLTDDGPGLGPMPGVGRGTAGMRSRAEQLHGSIDWTPGSTGGTKVVLQFPLPPD